MSGCPDGYTCASDGRCHRDGTDPDLACPTVDSGAGYSPRIVSSVPTAGQIVDRMLTLTVIFDVDVLGIEEASFFVVVRSTQTRLAGIADYSAKTATLTVPGGMPASEQLDMILTDAILDPRTSQRLMEAPISFSTLPDTAAPRVVTIVPTNGDAGLSVLTDVVARFDEQVTGVNTANVTLRDATGVLPATVVYTASQRTARLVPQDQLAAQTTYTVTIDNLFDTSSNQIAPFTSTFMTGADTERPGINLTVPEPGATGVALGANVVVTFDEPVMNVTTTSFRLNNGAIAGAITMSNGNRTVTFDPTANLPAASTITVSMTSAITDTSGNAAVVGSFSFATL